MMIVIKWCSCYSIKN